jgi:hypothetical protein
MMTITPSVLGQLSDQDLLAQVQRAAQDERHATAQLIALLMELDTRRLYLGEGFSSLFTFCTQAIHLSEHAAYNRIETARAARRFPIILDLVAEGAVTLLGRCTETGFLEYHHVMPFAAGGRTSASNIELRCSAHNQYEAQVYFGQMQAPVLRERRELCET